MKNLSKIFICRVNPGIVMALFILAILSSHFVSAQVNYSGTINYSPPNGEDGCLYSINVAITMTIMSGSNGMGIDYDIKVASFKGLIIDGTTIGSSQLPASVVHEYANPPAFYYLPVKYTVKGGGASKAMSSRTSNSLDWYLLLGKNFTMDEKIDEPIKQQGISLYNSGSISISDVAIDGVLVFNKLPYAEYMESQEKNETKVETSNNGTSSSNAEDDFWNDKKSSSSSNNTATTNQQNDTKQKSPTEDEINKSVQKQTDDFWNDKAETDKKIEQQSALRMQNYNDAVAVQDAKDDLRATTSLNETYASVEALMADFNEKMSQINNQVRTLTDNNNAEWNSRVDASFNGSDDATMNEGLKLIGGIVNEIKAADDEKYYREKLEKEKEAKFLEIQETKKRMLTAVRTELFTKFKEGSLPLSSTKVDAGTLYYFAYAYDPDHMDAETPVLYLSNIFPIGRYGDGTWPFKSTIVGEISNLSPYNETLNGYYLSEKEASVMQQGMANIFQKTDGAIQYINYKGKPAHGNIDQSGDFWGTGDNKTKPELASNTADDFWETGSKKINSESSDKKADDFWETGTKEKTTDNNPDISETEITEVDYIGVRAIYKKINRGTAGYDLFMNFKNITSSLEATLTISSGDNVIFQYNLGPGAIFQRTINSVDIDVQITYQAFKEIKPEADLYYLIKKMVQDNVTIDKNAPKSHMSHACMCVRG
jgi:hypothetical protein